MNPGWLIAEIGRAVWSSFRDLPEPGPAEGFCSDALARGLGAFAVAFAVLAFVAAAVQ